MPKPRCPPETHLVVLRPHPESSRPNPRRCWRSLGAPSRALCARIKNNTGSRLQPIRGDPVNPPPEETNTIVQACTPQAQHSGPAREMNLHCRVFAYWGRLFGGRLPPPLTRRRRRFEPRAELLHLQKTYPSRIGQPAMPGQILPKLVMQTTSQQPLPPVAAHRVVLHTAHLTEHLPRQPSATAVNSQFALVSYPSQVPPRLSTTCSLCKEMQRPLCPPGKVVVSAASPTKPPIGNTRNSKSRTTQHADPVGTATTTSPATSTL